MMQNYESAERHWSLARAREEDFLPGPKEDLARAGACTVLSNASRVTLKRKSHKSLAADCSAK